MYFFILFCKQIKQNIVVQMHMKEDFLFSIPECVKCLNSTLSKCWMCCFSYEKYFLMCALTHNGKNLFKPVQSKRVGTYKSFFYHVKWDEL